MRRTIVAAMLAALPQAAPGQGFAGATCAEQAALVMSVVDARRAGTDPEPARQSLAETLPDGATDMLIDWVYSLPEAQLTDEIATAWETQCEAL